METFYLFLVIFLFVLAIVDLSVGVSNDAVNFLNSAIGARAASFKVIIAIAAVGVFVGAALSNGMMDIARHGIYQPQHFYFSEIDEFMSRKSGLIDKEDFTPEQQVYYDYTCQTGDFIKMCTVPSLRMDESDLVKEKKMLTL